MTEQRLIGLLTPFFQPIPAYERAAAALGVELAIVTPSRVDWQSEEVQALAFDGSKWEEKLVPLPGVLQPFLWTKAKGGQSPGAAGG